MGFLSGIGKSLGGAIGGIANLAGGAGKGGKTQYKQAIRAIRKVQEPDFKYTDLTWPELQFLYEQFPELYKAVVPPEAQQVADSPETRDAQMRSLALMERVRDEGLPLEERLAANQAQEAIMGASRRANTAVMSDLARRGRLGAGDEMQARLVANQGQQNLSSSLGSDLARQAIANRLGAATSAFGMGGQIRGQDIALGTTNADIINRYNELAANILNKQNMYNVEGRNRAQAYNAAERQRLSEQNKMGALGLQRENQAERNRLQELLFRARFAKATGEAGALQDLGQQKYAEQASRAGNIYNVATGTGGALGGLADLFGVGGGGGGNKRSWVDEYFGG